MKIVIDIPEEVFDEIYNKNYYSLKGKEALRVAVRNGTQLPKGHGDLIDRHDLLKMTKSYKSELGRLKADPFVKCGIETVESFIKEMSAIIEADGEAE